MKTLNYTFLLLFIILVSSCFENEPYYYPDNYSNNSRTNPNIWTDTVEVDTIDPATRVLWLRTYTSENWDYWEIGINDSISGYLKTYTSENWDYWEFEVGEYEGTIRTYTSEDWDNWEFNCEGYDISLQTYFSEDWDNWKIQNANNGFQLRAQTSFSEDWDHWEIFNSVIDLDFYTYTSEDWDYWELYGDISELETPYIIAASFIPIFTSSIYMQEIIE